MKNLILETMKYCFIGYNQFLICETKTQAKSYLKQNSSINRIKDLKVITGEMRKEILNSFENFFHTVYDISSGYAVPLENEDEYSAMTVNAVSDKALAIIKSAVAHHLDTVANNYDAWFAVYDYLPDTNEDCPNCADQASIAAPGETVLCNTHNYEQHFFEMRRFFNEYIQEIILKPHLPFCSRCGADAPDYVLLLRTSDGSPLNFAACTNCRNELTLKQNAARAAQERIGA